MLKHCKDYFLFFDTRGLYSVFRRSRDDRDRHVVGFTGNYVIGA